VLYCASAASFSEDRFLSIACASNFKPTLVKLIELYQSSSADKMAADASLPNSTWVYKISSGSTAQLAIQIQNGAPHHLFFAADQRSQELLLESGDIIPDSLVPYAQGKLAYWEPNSIAPVERDTLVSTLKAGHRITLANPKLAPYGKLAQRILEQAGFPISENSPIIANNAAHSFQLVYQKQLKGGFVPLSLLKAKSIEPSEYWVVASFAEDDLLQTASITQIEHNTAAYNEARRLLEFILSSSARALLEADGYGHAHSPKSTDRPDEVPNNNDNKAEYL